MSEALLAKTAAAEKPEPLGRALRYGLTSLRKHYFPFWFYAFRENNTVNEQLRRKKEQKRHTIFEQARFEAALHE
jgi:hypothetical protein